MFGEDQLIRELKLGRVNQERMGKWIKTVYMPKAHIPPQSGAETT
jgi:hypothetical protein